MLARCSRAAALGALRGALLAAGFASAGGAGAERPSFTLAPYVWVPQVKGEVSLGQLAVPLSLPVRELAKGFKGGGLGYVSADWRHVFVYGEGIYIRYGNDRFAPFFGEAVHANVAFGEGGFGLHREIGVGRTTLRVSPYVGLRYIALHARVSGALVTKVAGNRATDPVAGAIVEAPVAPRLGLVAKLDGAGLGLTHDHYLSAAGLVEYRLNRRIALDAGYRYTHATIPSASDLGLSLRGHGPLIGLRYTIPAR